MTKVRSKNLPDSDRGDFRCRRAINSPSFRCVQMQICGHGNGHGWCPNIVNELTHLSPGKYGDDFKSILFKLLIQNSSLGAHCKSVLRWMSQNLTSEMSTLVQVMAWCRQPTSHYLDQCCPRSLMPYGIISPWWINIEKKILVDRPLQSSHAIQSLQTRYYLTLTKPPTK